MFYFGNDYVGTQRNRKSPFGIQVIPKINKKKSMHFSKGNLHIVLKFVNHLKIKKNVSQK